MIDISDLSFAYANSGFRLTIPSLKVATGEKVAVVGPSGTGKTTLLNLIAGICIPDKGRVKLGDTTLSDLGDSARRSFRSTQIGFVFQDFALLEYLSARENILYPYRITSGARLSQDARQRAARLAASCGLADKLDRHPGALSQGEQQRVALCRALVMQPKLILADEATGNLDPQNKSLILDMLFERTMEEGAALLAVTHDHELLPRFDRVIDFGDFRKAGDGQ